MYSAIASILNQLPGVASAALEGVKTTIDTRFGPCEVTIIDGKLILSLPMKLHGVDIREANDAAVGIAENVLPSGDTEWRLRGQLHNEDDRPAFVSADGTIKKWYDHDKLNRIGGPAVITPEGEFYFSNNMPHRQDGPAVKLTNGTERWFTHGELNRIGGPAITIYSDDGMLKSMQQWENNVLISTMSFGTADVKRADTSLDTSSESSEEETARENVRMYVVRPQRKSRVARRRH